MFVKVKRTRMVSEALSRNSSASESEIDSFWGCQDVTSQARDNF